MRQMKDSGIEWVGEIPENWNIKKGKFIFKQRNSRGNDIELQLLSPTQKYGVIPQSMYEQLSGMKAVKLDESTDFALLKIVHKGDYCISLRSFQGGFELSEYDGVVSPAYQVFYPVTSVDRRYFKYMFKDKSFIDKMNSYTMSLRDGKNIAYSDFADSYLPIPPIQIQSKIAAALDYKCTEIDNAIFKTTASIEEYKKLKQSIITKAVTKGIRGNRPMKDSGIEWIGEIPANWDVCFSSRFITSTQNGLTRRDSKDSQGNIVLKLKNISADGVINYHYKNRISLTDKELENYRLYSGDLLFVRVNGSKELVGKNAIYQDIGELVAYNDHIIRVRLDKKVCNEEYFHWFLMSNYGKCQIELHTATAAGQYTISSEGLKDIRVTVPSMSEQVEIISYLDKKTKNIDNIISRKQQLITELKAYKKSLIYEYVTGKKEVV